MNGGNRQTFDIFFYLFGFYFDGRWMGRELFKRRFWANGKWLILKDTFRKRK